MINDMNGFPFGRTGYGRPVNLDMWSRETNNMLVTGAAGSGKTMLVKHTLLHQHYMGTKVIVIDLNREYKELCKALDGYWLDGTADYIECPIQVLSENFIVIDMYVLRNASSAIKSSHYAKVLAWSWSRLTRRVDERVLIVIDDYTGFNIGPIGQQVTEMTRQSRLYSGGLLLTVTSAQEFPCDVAAHATYVAIMCLGSKRFEDLSRIRNFNQDDIDFVAQRKRYTALLAAGSDTEQVTMDIPADEMSMLGNSKFSRRFF